jgi:tripeptide aminopeptidase
LTNELLELFARLVELSTPSGQERACADLATAYLAGLGLQVDEDDAGAALGGDAGNLYCRVPPTVAGGIPLFFCAHLDTVPAAGPIEMVERDGYLSNAHPTILGVDNKAAVAVILDAVRSIVQAKRRHAGIELVLTVREEQALRGAKHFNCARLQGRYGFVLDHSAPIGGMVLSAPSRTIVRAEFVGRAAHAGIAPEEGRNAISAAADAISALRQGRIDSQTTVNVGRIEGGSAINVVAERCRLELEVRSLDRAACSSEVAHIAATLQVAAERYGCMADVRISEEYHAYRLDEDAAPVMLARAALEALGIEPRAMAGGGGADAHVFTSRGHPCLNLANGMQGMHGPDERIRREGLYLMRSVMLGIVEMASRSDGAPSGEARRGNQGAATNV